MKNDLTKILAEHEKTHPTTSGAIKQFLKAGDLLAPSINYLVENEGEEFWNNAEDLLKVFKRLTGADYERRLEALPRYTYKYLQTQVAYTRKGEYASSSFEDVREKVYDNAEVMEGFYLDGLYLTQAFWPGHLLVNRFFRKEFLKRVPAGAHFLEIGVGHGWFFSEILLQNPNAKATGMDISPYSIKFTDLLCKVRGVDPSRYSMRQGDAVQDLGVPAGSLDAVICGEVLEHVEEPIKLAQKIHEALRPGGLAYFSAPAKSDAMDHIHEFADADKVVELIRDAGLTPVVTQSLSLSDWNTSGRNWDPTVLALVVAQKEA
jgi:2-polyprenyl-3-methyl-5-hydroxy-6-metoxy-1,4-benzoquinol methylase